MQQVYGAANAWQVVGRPTENDTLNTPIGGVWTEANGGFAAAKSTAEAALGAPDNYFEVAILGPGSGLYRADA